MTISEVLDQQPHQAQPAHDAEASAWFKDVISRLQQKSRAETNQEDAKSKDDHPRASQGMLPSTKDVYEGQRECDCCINWVNEVPQEVKEDEAKAAETKTHALLVRHKKAHDIDRPPYVLHSIKIQSPLLRTVLVDVLRGYPGITPELENLTFEAPFQPFFHRLAEIRDAARSEIDPTTVEHLDLLFEAIATDLGHTIHAFEDCVSKQVITYEYLWTLFRPGDLVYSKRHGEDHVFLLRDESFTVEQEGKDQGVCVPCYSIDWDGDSFGWAISNIEIAPFKGTRAITSLKVFPLSFHPDAEELKGRLVERGRKFETLAGIHYKDYKGFVTWSDEYRQLMKLKPEAYVEGRIVIDAMGFKDFSYWDRVHLAPLGDTYSTTGVTSTQANQPNTLALLDFHQRARHAAAHNLPPPPHPHLRGRGMHPPPVTHPGVHRRIPGRNKDEKKTPQRPLCAEEHLLCASVVKGYCLSLKKWVQLNVNSIRDIPWGLRAFERLVLPNTIKDTIMTLVEGQLDQTAGFDDFMPGKGQGVVFLLTGSPGVGKTLTAESVAEHLQVPLYSLSATDLGEDAEGSQEAIEKVFPMMVRWKGVLLLDEADVFLARRSLDTPETNRVVSVFLRMLEYYRGILFLTTNRVECIDPAMKSRIHITLTYKDLTASTRKSIWQNFISASLNPIDITEQDIALLSEVEMNGRQIKNVFKIAGLLAARTKVSMSVKHIKAAMEVAATETTEIGMS